MNGIFSLNVCRLQYLVATQKTAQKEKKKTVCNDLMANTQFI